MYGESYGAKVAVILADLLHQEVVGNQIQCILTSVTAISGWIDPMGSTLEWTTYVRALGVIDEDGAEIVENSLIPVKEAYANNDFANDTALWRCVCQCPQYIFWP